MKEELERLILDNTTGNQNMHFDELITSIINLFDKELPEKKVKWAIIDGVDVSDQYEMSAIAVGYNQAIDDIRSKLHA